MKKNAWLIAFSYATVYIVWGSTYFFIKMAVETIPPFYVVGLRFLLGGLLLLALAFFTGRLRPFPSPKEIGYSILLGLFLLLGGNGLITLAEKQVDSYLAALIVASTPIVVALIDRIVLKKTIPFINLSGILLGILGVAFLVYNGHSIMSSLSPYILLVLAGILSFGSGTSIGHRLAAPRDAVVNSGIQMLFVGAISTLGMMFWGEPLIIPAISWPSWFGLIYLAVVGSFAFIAFNYLLTNEPGIRVASYALVNPVIAVLLGLFLGNETPVPYLMVGLPLILCGVFLMLYGKVMVDKVANQKKMPQVD